MVRRRTHQRRAVRHAESPTSMRALGPPLWCLGTAGSAQAFLSLSWSLTRLRESESRSSAGWHPPSGALVCKASAEPQSRSASYSSEWLDRWIDLSMRLLCAVPRTELDDVPVGIQAAERRAPV